MSASVQATGLSGGYRPGVLALEDVTFEARSGETVAVLAPNGGGKTTLFRALLGVLPLLEGECSVAGRLGYVPQTERSRLDFPVSAFDVTLMGAYARVPWYRRMPAGDRNLAREALARVGLADRAQSTFGELSGGQRQRVLIARALTQQADVLLLDEPFSGVDRASAAHIERVFGELAAEGRTLLIATHDIEQARRTDAVLCLNRRQVAFGEPAATLTVEMLKRTYGDEMIVIAPGVQAIAVEHHEH
jgi:manganese/iron transport system ATP-binding protein/manganese/zinc/iron transport system ATP- binding protein